MGVGMLIRWFRLGAGMVAVEGDTVEEGGKRWGVGA